MSKAELLSKLALKVPNMEPTIHGTARDGITQEDVAHALSMLKNGPYYLIRLKYALDETVLTYLKQELVMTCYEKNIMKDWLDKKPIKAQKIITIAVGDITASSECNSCKGVKYHILNDEITECQSCGGTGKKQIGRSEKAKQAGVHPKTWDECWNGKYMELMAILYDFESEGLRHFKKKLGQTG